MIYFYYKNIDGINGVIASNSPLIDNGFDIITVPIQLGDSEFDIVRKKYHYYSVTEIVRGDSLGAWRELAKSNKILVKSLSWEKYCYPEKVDISEIENTNIYTVKFTFYEKISEVIKDYQVIGNISNDTQSIDITEVSSFERKPSSFRDITTDFNGQTVILKRYETENYELKFIITETDKNLLDSILGTDNIKVSYNSNTYEFEKGTANYSLIDSDLYLCSLSFSSNEKEKNIDRQVFGILNSQGGQQNVYVEIKKYQDIEFSNIDTDLTINEYGLQKEYYEILIFGTENEIDGLLLQDILNHSSLELYDNITNTWLIQDSTDYLVDYERVENILIFRIKFYIAKNLYT